MYDYHVSNTIARSTVNQQYQSTTRPHHHTGLRSIVIVCCYLSYLVVVSLSLLGQQGDRDVVSRRSQTITTVHVFD